MRIVAAISSAPAADRVAEQAAALAARCGGSLTLVYVAAPPMTRKADYYDPDDYRLLRAEIRRADGGANAILAGPRRLAEAHGVEVQVLVIEADDVTEALIEATRELEADLLVIGTTRHHIIEQIVQPSVTARVLRRSRVPVVVVTRLARSEP